MQDETYDLREKEILEKEATSDQSTSAEEDSSKRELRKGQKKSPDHSATELNWLSKDKYKDLVGAAIKLPFCSIDRKYKSVKKRQNNYARVIKISRRLALHPFTHKNLEIF